MFDPVIRFFLLTQLRGQEMVKRTRDQEGAAAVEYGLLVALIAVAIVIAVAALGSKLSDLFDSVTASF